MARKRPSIQKREREYQKRQRELKKAAKSAEKRERRHNRDGGDSPGEAAANGGGVAESGVDPT